MRCLIHSFLYNVANSSFGLLLTSLGLSSFISTTLVISGEQSRAQPDVLAVQGYNKIDFIVLGRHAVYNNLEEGERKGSESVRL